jgi:diaminopimelate epimerase
MGNPHCVVFVPSVDDVDLEKIGPLFEKNEAFPEGTNTEFVEIINRNEVKMSVWERGAGATLACGTGACALVLAGYINDKNDKEVKVHLPGGDLDIKVQPEGDEYRIFMTGAADVVF